MLGIPYIGYRIFKLVSLVNGAKMSQRRRTILSLVFGCIFISIIDDDTVRYRKAQILQTQWVVFFNLFCLISHFTCISTIVICCITCTICKTIYIGETGKRLADRFREQLRKKKTKKQNRDASKPVTCHFNLSNHCRHNMTICGLSLHHGNKGKKIFQLGTLSPRGIKSECQ